MPDDNPLLVELKTTWEEFRHQADAREAEIKTLGEETAETKQAIGRLNEQLSAIEEQLKGFQRPALGGKGHPDQDARLRGKAFDLYLRTGLTSPYLQRSTEGWNEAKLMQLGLTPEEVKVLTVSDDTTGGFLAPDEFVSEIIKGIREFSPIRSIARVRSTSNRAIDWPKRTGTFNAAWVSESGTRSESTGLAWGMEQIPNHEMYALVDISTQNLEDSAYDLESELRTEFSEAFAVLEGTAFCTGNAVGRPEGIAVNADVSTVNSGHASLFQADGIIKLVYALKEGYSAGARFVMKRSSVQAVRLLKDSQGRYLYSLDGGLNAAEPGLLLGYPVVEATDVAAEAANALACYFGDFRRGYLIVDRVGMDVLRDPFTQAASGNVRFIARRRVGGQVILPEALKIQKIAA